MPKNVVWQLVLWALVLTSIGTFAHLLSSYHSRWLKHTEQLAQYQALANSPLCLDAVARVQTSDVNNCARAERATGSRALTPALLALLETLQQLSLCASEDSNHTVQNRCDLVLRALIDSSAKVLLLAIVLLIGVIWFVRQYMHIVHMRDSRLPLEEPNYPAAAHMAPWFREKLLKED